MGNYLLLLSRLHPKKSNFIFIPAEMQSFTCPLTHEVFTDPVIAMDGYTYERSAITKWMKFSSKSPMTHAELPSRTFLTNYSLLRQLQSLKPRFPNKISFDYFDFVPVDLIRSIFGLVDCATLCILSQVCRKFQQLADDKFIWKDLFHAQFGSKSSTQFEQSNMNMKQAFRKLFLELRDRQSLKKIQMNTNHGIYLIVNNNVNNVSAAS